MLRRRRRVLVSAIALFSLVEAVGVAIPAAHAAPSAAVVAGTPSVPASASQMEADIFYLMNVSRAVAGLPPLVRNATLDARAKNWSIYLSGNNCYTGSAPICHSGHAAMKSAANAAAYPQTAKWWAENVQDMYGGDAQKSHNRFMNSPAHRANIMRKDTNAVGIGVVIRDDGYIFVTHLFAQIPAPPKPPHPCGMVSGTFSYGSRGSRVRVLQCALQMVGLYAGPVNGRFDKATKAAVKLFQSQHGLRVTGTANLVTRRAIGITR